MKIFPRMWINSTSLPCESSNFDEIYITVLDIVTLYVLKCITLLTFVASLDTNCCSYEGHKEKLIRFRNYFYGHLQICLPSNQST